MNKNIIKTFVPSESEWDDAWLNCPYSTYFHSREWAEIWMDYSQGNIKPDPLGVILSDGTQIVLPFSVKKIMKGYARQYISSPAGTYGGWLSNVSLDKAQQVVVMKIIAQRYPDLIWRTNPYEKMLLFEEFKTKIPDETHALDLSIGFEGIYSRWTKGHASAARKARKVGVEIIIAKTREDWENYYRVYEDSLIRWGENTTSVYTWNLFEIIFKRASPNIKLWLARFDGSVIACALCFYSPSHVVYWHGAALSSYFKIRPVNLLMYEIIRHAAENKFKWFDFNPSGGHEGVKAFKRNFGTIPLSCDVITAVSLKTRLISRIAQLRNYILR